MRNADQYCIIMAGGNGSRFWPISRNSKPKQFLDIMETGRTFLQEIFRRFEKIMYTENIYVVTSQEYEPLVREQIPSIRPENILAEPHRRNTAPCIAYATYKILKKNRNACAVVTPADNLILDEAKFLETMKIALDYSATHNELLTIGVKPTRPETVYGYIQINRQDMVRIEGQISYGVKTFTEKPDEALAKVFVDSGEFYWNSGIFIWNLQTIAAEMEKFIPEIAHSFKDGMHLYDTINEKHFIKEVYESVNSTSISFGVMEKTSRTRVFVADFDWSDLGTWPSLYKHAPKDANLNLVKADNVLLEGVRGSVVMTSKKGKLIAVNGLEDYMIVDTDDVLMICPKNVKDIKNLMTDLALNDLSNFQ